MGRGSGSKCVVGILLSRNVLSRESGESYAHQDCVGSRGKEAGKGKIQRLKEEVQLPGNIPFVVLHRGKFFH